MKEQNIAVMSSKHYGKKERNKLNGEDSGLFRQSVRPL